MEEDGEIEVEDDHDLSDDGELAEVPDVCVIVVHVSDEHYAVEQ